MLKYSPANVGATSWFSSSFWLQITRLLDLTGAYRSCSMAKFTANLKRSEALLLSKAHGGVFICPDSLLPLPCRNPVKLSIIVTFKDSH